jgi:hypothetical protein
MNLYKCTLNYLNSTTDRLMSRGLQNTIPKKAIFFGKQNDA